MRNKNIKFYNIQEVLIKYSQTKGNPMSYAGYLFRESFKYFIGAFIYYFKALIKYTFYSYKITKWRCPK